MKALLLAATLAFRGATLIDGRGGPTLPNSLLVVSGDRIASVSQATPEALALLPPASSIHEANGKWIVPGLIDAHVHAGSEEELRAMLRWGVTSVRLMAEDVAEARDLAERSRKRGDIPDLFPASPIFTARGGWWDEGQPAGSKLNRFPETPRQAREAVRQAAALGASEIKLMLDDMAWCRAPELPLARLSPRISRAILSEARKSRLRASVHAPQISDARKAVAYGATLLAHGVLEPLDPGTVKAMKRRGVFYVPTMGVFEFLADTQAFMGSVLSDPRAAAGLPASLLARYRSPAYSELYRQRYPNFENVSRHLPALRENLRTLHASGVPVALGTDMWAFPGLGVSVEMELYVRAGLSPLEAIGAATEAAARSLAVEGDRGTLVPGRRADFLVLEADPLADVANVRSIHAIYKGGERVWPKAGEADSKQ